MNRSVWIGWEPREADAFAVARHSINRRARLRVPVLGLQLKPCRARGLYYRPTERREGQLWDVVSNAPMATEFACSRFLVPRLARSMFGGGWALFMDCDMLVRTDINALFDQCYEDKAVMVVKHEHKPAEGVKMDGQMQTAYARKNWSSVCAFNLDHPANEELTPRLVNTLPGRDLHAFCWLDDDDIGELHPRWNYLVGHTEGVRNPGVVHFTDGSPAMPGYETCEYADEWRTELERWAR